MNRSFHNTFITSCIQRPMNPKTTFCKIMHYLFLNKHTKFKRDWAKNNTIIVIQVINSVV